MTNFKNIARLAVASLGLSGLSTAAIAGGAINIATIGEPDSLDPMISTKLVVSTVSRNILEKLYTFDGDTNVAPMLAEDLPVISEDGKTYTIAIRKGITFHDGSVMDAHDAVDSLLRWTRVAGRGKAANDFIESISAADDYTVVIQLKSSYAPLLSMLSLWTGAPYIYPQEQIVDTPIKEPIGTGPYRLEEHKPDQYIRLVRFDDYVMRDEEPNGAAGRREAILDELRFIPVANSNTRVEGLLSGQFHFASSLPAQAVDRIAASDTAEPLILVGYGKPIFAHNLRDGLLTNVHFRRAVQAAANPSDMLAAAFGDEKFYGVSGPVHSDRFPWHTDAGVDLFNQADPKAAAEHLKKGGYDGTPLRLLTSRQYEFHFQMAQVFKANLEEAGFKVKMDVVDWATLGQRRADPALWDIFITHSPYQPEPTMFGPWNPKWLSGWTSPEKDDAWNRLSTAVSLDDRKTAYEDLHRLMFEEATLFQPGYFNDTTGKSKDLLNVEAQAFPFFWNAKLAD